MRLFIFTVCRDGKDTAPARAVVCVRESDFVQAEGLARNHLAALGWSVLIVETSLPVSEGVVSRFGRFARDCCNEARVNGLSSRVTEQDIHPSKI